MKWKEELEAILIGTGIAVYIILAIYTITKVVKGLLVVFK